MSVKPTSVPTKRLAGSILSTEMTFRVDNILGWDGNALVAGDFGTQGYGVFRDAARTRLELFEFDPSTIADASITINKRGLKFDGDRTTEETNNKFDWTSGDTYVDLGTDTPQIIQYFQDYIDALAIAGAPVASTTVAGLVEEATLAQVQAGTDTGETGAQLFVPPSKLSAIRVEKQKFTSSGTWTKPTGAKMVEVFLIGGGGGGGAGSSDSSSTYGGGGGGGGGGGYTRIMFDATSLGATETVTVGTGGQGGQTVNASGSSGINTSFGTVVRAQANAGTGGAYGQVNNGATGAAAGGSGLTEDGAVGGQGGSSQGAGGSTKIGAGCGGGGAGSSSGAGTGSAGGAKTLQTLAGGTGSATNTNGGAGNTFDTDEPIGGTGGGGSGCITSGAGTYKGGDGGLYGGGGGGGGSYTGSTWGKGGNGADGIAVVLTYF